MITINTKVKTHSIVNRRERLLSELTQDSGLFLNMRCGGQGSCGGCAVALEEGLYLVNGKEIEIKNKCKRSALACKTRVLSSEAELSVPDSSLIELTGKIDQDFQLKSFIEDTQTKKFYMKLPPSTLEDPVADTEKLQVELKNRSLLKNIYLPLDALQKLPEALKVGRQEITVTIGRIRSYWFVINIEPGDTRKVHLAVAVDIGTTTVVGVLIDLSNCQIIGKASRYNQQITQADDVASRISYANNQSRVKQLQRLVVEDTINPIVEELCQNTGFKPGQINRMAISGNTIMTSLFLGVSPETIGKIPFQPAVRDPGEYLARDVGVNINSHGIIDMVPAISGYVGGDITSDIYVSQIHKNDSISLMVDIGTNGEMIFANKNKLVACAVPAGPAFEGAGIKFGCRAISGAIDTIKFNNYGIPIYTTIGGAKPKGICGSALIDFIAGAFELGYLNGSGRFNYESLKEKNLMMEVPECNGFGLGVLLANAIQTDIGSPIYITEQDIAQILQAKAAIFAGLKTLIQSQGFSFNEINKFILAGGFAKHINLRNAITIGLLPDISIEKIEVIGNGSLAGSFLTIIEPNALVDMKEISKMPKTIELNLEPEFQDNYIDALFLPNADEKEFKSVIKKY